MKNVLFAAWTLLFLLFSYASAADDAEATLPNILWLTSEDHGPQMGPYGDDYATTPNVDALAARGLTYEMVWSNAPVCAPARTAIISGMYPPSTGSEHMRSYLPYPRGKKMYPELLSEAGYYCTNNQKEDYNLAAPNGNKGWHESSGDAHWRNRPAGKPFFAIFNSTSSHESQVRRRPYELKHDPEKAPVPAYHPDTPEVRLDWAQYYDVVSEADAAAGVHLAELEEAGLADDTIVFYYGDHGSGLPRGKRWPGNSGQHVPLVVYIPEKFEDLRPPDYQAGGRSDRLVGFVDLAPTLLSLAGVEPPEWMQGSAFLGRHPGAPPQYLYGFRGRMDERTDLVRSVTDGRYVYLRNYLPYLPAGQYLDYQFRTPTTRVWWEEFIAGRLTPEQSAFWLPRPPEELYDLQTDPDEVNNLADSPQHQEIKARLRKAQQEHARAIQDVGFLPEGEFFTRDPGVSPYDFARKEGVYPFERIFAMAELASMGGDESIDELENGLKDEDSAVRYWAALGLRMREEQGVASARGALRSALQDSSPYVRIAAADALATYGNDQDRRRALELLGAEADPSGEDGFASSAALFVIDGLAEKAAPLLPAIFSYKAEAIKLPHERYSIVPQALLDSLQNSPLGSQ